MGTFISEDFNRRLIEDYKEEELYSMLKGMDPTKASGTDGFPALFFLEILSYCGMRCQCLLLGNS